MVSLTINTGMLDKKNCMHWWDSSQRAQVSQHRQPATPGRFPYPSWTRVHWIWGSMSARCACERYHPWTTCADGGRRRGLAQSWQRQDSPPVHAGQQLCRLQLCRAHAMTYCGGDAIRGPCRRLAKVKIHRFVLRSAEAGICQLLFWLGSVSTLDGLNYYKV